MFLSDSYASYNISFVIFSSQNMADVMSVGPFSSQTFILLINCIALLLFLFALNNLIIFVY